MDEQMIKVFLSYPFDNKEAPEEIVIPDKKALLLSPAQFVHRLNYYLNKQAELESFCYPFGPDRQDWDDILRGQLDTSDRFVLFWAGRLGSGQSVELEKWKEIRPETYAQHTVLVTFWGCSVAPSNWNLGTRLDLDALYAPRLRSLLPTGEARDINGDRTDAVVGECARIIFEKLRPDVPWIPPDGLPIGYPFDYEKDIIEEFVQGRGRLPADPAGKRLEQGCPLEWPRVKCVDASRFAENPIHAGTTGRRRDPDKEKIIVDVRSQYHKPSGGEKRVCLAPDETRSISFLEAGPRAKICYPLREGVYVGIVVSGGIAPGINAVIAGICARHNKYQDEHHLRTGEMYLRDFTMYRDGFLGLCKDFKVRLPPREAQKLVGENANLGGAWISTARHDDLLDTRDKADRHRKLDAIVARLQADHIDILYVIGGEGTMRAAHAVATRARQWWLSGALERQISVVGIPKTMDNDILWVWQAFGFLSAVEKAKEFIAQLDTEAKSNPRLCIVQLFGSDSGFVVSHAALASGVCRAALIPEVGFTMARLSDHILGVLKSQYDAKQDRLQQSPYGIILLAETAIPRDIENYIDEPKYPEVELSDREKEAIRRFVGSVLLNPSDIEDWPGFLRELATGAKEGRSTAIKAVCDLLPTPIRQMIGVYQAPEVRKNADVPREVQSVIIKALNASIWDVELHGLDDPASPAGSLSRRLTYFLECMEVINVASKMEPTEIEKVYGYLFSKLRNQQVPGDYPLKRDLVTVLQSLDRYPLSYEAKAAVNSLIERMSKKYLERIQSLLKHIAGDSSESAQPLEPAQQLARAQRLERAQRTESRIRSFWVGQFRQDTKELYPELVRTYKRLFLEKAFSKHIRRRRTSGDRRVHGQTPDELRLGGLKVVSAVLQRDIRDKLKIYSPYWEQFRVFVNEPRHLIRAISPSVSDVIFGQRLGVLAVDNAMAGYTDFMVSQWLTEYVLVPLDLVVLGRKRVPQNGIFWKSVLQSTGQPANMLHEDGEDPLDSPDIS